MGNTQIKAFGRYWLADVIGRGGMGEVYRAYHVGRDGIKVPYAVKVLKADRHRDETVLNLFRTEAKLSSRLKNNGIASFIEFLKVGEQHALVTEYIEGIDLRQLLQNRSQDGTVLPVLFALGFMVQVAEGLSYLHRFADPLTGKNTPVVHGDLSPQNILINFECEAKLIDFGIACLKREMRSDLERSNFANPYYASRGRVVGNTIRISDDIFGFGLIFYEILTGERYHSGKALDEIIASLVSFTPRDPREVRPDLSASLAAIVMKCLNAENENGYQSMEEIEFDLHQELQQFNPGTLKSQCREYLHDCFATELREAQSRRIEIEKCIDDTAKADGTQQVPLVVAPPAGTQAVTSPVTSGVVPPAEARLQFPETAPKIVSTTSILQTISMPPVDQPTRSKPVEEKVVPNKTGGLKAFSKKFASNSSKAAAAKPTATKTNSDDVTINPGDLVIYRPNWQKQAMYVAPVVALIAIFGYRHHIPEQLEKMGPVGVKVAATLKRLPSPDDYLTPTHVKSSTETQLDAITAADPNGPGAPQPASVASTVAPEVAKPEIAHLVWIRSKPSGAEVFFQGERVGLTPISISTRPSQAASLNVELKPYSPFSLVVRGNASAIVVDLSNGSYVAE